MAERIVEPELYVEYNPKYEHTLLKEWSIQQFMNKSELYNADPNCDHHVVDGQGGGVRCTKCPGWFCY